MDGFSCAAVKRVCIAARSLWRCAATDAAHRLASKRVLACARLAAPAQLLKRRFGCPLCTKKKKKRNSKIVSSEIRQLTFGNLPDPRSVRERRRACCETDESSNGRRMEPAASTSAPMAAAAVKATPSSVLFRGWKKEGNARLVTKELTQHTESKLPRSTKEERALTPNLFLFLAPSGVEPCSSRWSAQVLLAEFSCHSASRLAFARRSWGSGETTERRPLRRTTRFYCSGTRCGGGPCFSFGSPSILQTRLWKSSTTSKVRTWNFKIGSFRQRLTESWLS